MLGSRADWGLGTGDWGLDATAARAFFRGGEPERLALHAIAQEFSPRYERHRDDLVSIGVRGLARLLGPARAIGEELRREAAARV